MKMIFIEEIVLSSLSSLKYFSAVIIIMRMHCQWLVLSTKLDELYSVSFTLYGSLKTRKEHLYNITIANFKIDRTNNNIKHNFSVHWNPRTIMTPNLAPFLAQNVVITTISDANRGDKVDIMITSSHTCFKLWLRSNEWQPHLLCCRPQGDVVIVLSIPTVTE